jgi:dipeptidyl aminopeptidase/acylaminoacyl peptidase
MPEPALFTADDLYQLGWIEDPRVSPDGRMVAYVRVTVDRARNRYRRAIWLVPAAGGAPRRLTSGLKSDTTPRWRSDGRLLAFVSDREDDTPQIYTIALGGGEARRLTRLRHGATEPAWAPHGGRIAFLGRANEQERAAEDRGDQPAMPEDEWEIRQLKMRQDHEEALRFDPRVLTRLPYRGGTSFYDDRRNQIYLVDFAEEGEDGAEPATPRRLTDGDFHHGAPVWMPGGDAILTTATRDLEADSIFAYYDVLRIPVPDSGRDEPIRLTEAGFSYFDPTPSPDGRLIALRRLPDDRPLAAGARIAVMPAAGGTPRDLTAEADLSVERFHWQPGGEGLLFAAGWRGAQEVYQVALPHKEMGGHGDDEDLHLAVSPSPCLLVSPAPNRFVEAFDVGPDGGVAMVVGSAANPCELYMRSPDGAEIQLTRINTALLAQRAVAPIEELVYVASDGCEVQGWAIRPPDYDPARQYPLAVHIHGGPHVMWGPGFRSMWHEWQVAAARGYVVFFCNPRGSEGYGERWRDAIHASWGTSDAPDILAGVDAMIARGGVDPARVAVTGGSYGGYMTVWLIAHSDRFRCAVAARGVYNLISEHSTSDAHELIELEFDGYPWQRHELLWAHSPLAHAHKIRTPLRILHSERDYRVPISEAEQLFASLRRRKQVVELVRYPREGHELTRAGEPRHRADHMERTLEWFDRYCKPSDIDEVTG